jgi:hypothetical protein
MKVALVISGLARKVEEGYTQYFKNIIDNYDTDVYLHYWEDTNYDEYKKVLDVYSPKKYIALKPFSFEKYQIGISVANGMDSTSRPMPEYGIKGCFNSLPIFYGWQSAFNLIEEKYDCIIRSRYDIGNDDMVFLDMLDLNKINISAHHWSGSEIPDDNLLITNQLNANLLLSDIFDTHIKIIQSEKVIYFNEFNFMNILKEKKLYNLINKSNQLKFSLLREFKVWY